MTAAERIQRLAPLCSLFPELGISGREDLRQLLRAALGRLDALDRFVPYGRGWSRAIAPQRLYHVLASTVPVSGWRSLVEGLLLGSENLLQCPDEQSDAMARFCEALPPALRKLVRILPSYSEDAFASADAIVVFGRDETIRLFRARCRKDQLFLAYGHRASLLWLGAVGRPTTHLVKGIVQDLTEYDQAGCLSPQCLILESEAAVLPLAELLARGLSENALLDSIPRRPEEAARIREARVMARALGWPLWEDGDRLQWTLVVRDLPQFQPTCGHRVLYLDRVPREKLESWLAPLRGHLSAVGVAGRVPLSVQKLFWRLGASRCCRVGTMQSPPPLWHHDGRIPLADLIRWVDWEGAHPPERQKTTRFPS
ncbi:acyl-CoA reductase [Verrucomicrobium sp. 3C]|uniref:acyl-CoA reductase n=1 Tax=Verrucomicrobium sp. 3C TaxID=1134055 RepID=UPI0003780F6A|nr:acyl-CoA reductase [Verrucomicrobium sp. 3C]